MDGVCIFCRGTPLTSEHLWPNWLRQEVSISVPFDHHIEQDSDGLETRNLAFSKPPFNQVVKAVCATCNGGWMSKIESEVKPILQDLIYGRGRTLDSEEQRKLATWGFLKACVFDELHPRERVVPAAHRDYLFVNKEPPTPGVAIWLGTYVGDDVGHYAYQGIKLAPVGLPDPEYPTMYMTTITVGALIVQVAGSLVTQLSFDALPLPPELHVAKIWPPQVAEVSFAQCHVMDHSTLVGFTKMLYNVIGRIAGEVPPAR